MRNGRLQRRIVGLRDNVLEEDRHLERGQDDRYPRYGEVWLVNLDPVVGKEIGKTGPAVVVSNDYSNLYSATVTVLPLSGRPATRRYRHEVIMPKAEAGLDKTFRIKANQIRTLDKARLVFKIGTVPALYYSDISRAISLHLNLRV